MANGPKFPVTGSTPGQFGFVGIDSLIDHQILGDLPDPADPGIATNGSQVFESVNLTMRIYSSNGTALTPAVSAYSFFGVQPITNRYIASPHVFFDPQSNRFFITALEYFFDTYDLINLGSQDLVAVSATNDALGNYFVYSIDACSASDEMCLGDHPQVGVNQDGFYLASNDYGNYPYDGAFIVALDKQALISGSATVNGTAILLPNDFAIQPALSAPGASSTGAGGTEYFTESLDSGAGGSSLRLIALTGTATLSDPVPLTSFASTDIATQTYSNPSPANQKAGPYPFGQSLGDPEQLLSTGDDRLQQLYYANGKLYTTLETGLTDPAFTRSGAAWFIMEPSATSTIAAGHVVNQGYIGIRNGTVMYPAFAVDNHGNGVIGFSFSGNDYFPSAGYVRVKAGSVEQTVHTARPGEAPDDDYTGYAAFPYGTDVANWGESSAATIAPDGHVWFAAEYIASRAGHRTQFTNWSTFISQVM